MKFGLTIFSILLIIAVLLSPFLFVWAWNNLFGALLLIPYTFQTWFSVLILYAFFNGKVVYKEK